MMQKIKRKSFKNRKSIAHYPTDILEVFRLDFSI